MKAKEISVVSLALPLLLFLAAAVGAFVAARPVPEVGKFVGPSAGFLESTRRIRALDEKVSKIGFVGATLRTDIEKTLTFMTVENVTLVTDPKTQLIALDAGGTLRASKLNEFFAEMDRPGVYVENFVLSVGPGRGGEEEDPVFTFKLKASLLPRRAVPPSKKTAER